MYPFFACASLLTTQENDFGGWPEDVAELPVTHMTQEHMTALLAKCSKYKDTAMPIFPESPTRGSETTALSQMTLVTANTGVVTPPPNTSSSVATAQQQQQKKNDPKGKTSSTITPCPGAMATAVVAPATKPSKAQLEIHRKWQAAAEAAAASGTHDAAASAVRIVLSKPVAKKIIYDFLYDAFRPMNITEIHKVLYIPRNA
jgi:hypothetical protein